MVYTKIYSFAEFEDFHCFQAPVQAQLLGRAWLSREGAQAGGSAPANCLITARLIAVIPVDPG